MRATSLLSAAVAAGLALALGGCLPFAREGWDEPPAKPGPGCRIDLFKLPNLQGFGLPVVRDTPELAEEWHNVASARIVYGTWRLYTDRDYKGFMGDYAAPLDVPLLVPTGHLGSLQCLKPAPVPG
jgi:hypothetical protein